MRIMSVPVSPMNSIKKGKFQFDEISSPTVVRKLKQE